MKHSPDQARQLFDSASDTVDFASPAQQETLHRTADQLTHIDAEHVVALAQLPHAPLEFRISSLLAESKRFVRTIDQPLKIAVVFAMWGEQNRLQPRSENNPNGEDALRVKLDQLNWLFAESPVEWTLIAVDDGCPHDSGQLADEIGQSHSCRDNLRVLWLEQTLPQQHGPLAGLKSADDSRKGGAVIYGCTQALKENVDAVIYTDADNSVHLGQTGLLLQPYLQGKKVILGNRKDPHSVLVKQEARWGIGITFLRHIQRMVGDAVFSTGIRDTQAAFKLYDQAALQNILTKRTVFDFSFDTDWLLASIAANQELTTTPFAFIDSAAESASITQGPMSTWHGLLTGLVTQVRAHGVAVNDDICTVLDEHVQSVEDLESVIDYLPPQLENTCDNDLGDPDLMSPAEIADWFMQCAEISKTSRKAA